MKLSENINKKNKMCLSSWKEFCLSELFDIAGTKTTPKKDVIKNQGLYPYVTTASKNNGVKFYSNIWTEKGKCLVIDSAVAGYMSYQEKNFSASDHVEKLVPKFFINKEIAIFICCVWNSNKMTKKYSYVLKASQTQLKKDTIFLPSINNKPNWKYMEKFIIDIHKEIFLNLQNLSIDIKNKEMISTNSWKEFGFIKIWKDATNSVKYKNLNGIFKLNSTLSGIDNNKLININSKEFNLVTRTDINNGIFKKVGHQNKPIDKGKCITIGLDTQSVFWQDEDFYTSQNINIIRHERLTNKYIGLFIVSSISKLIKLNFRWGNKGATLSRLCNLKIKLPVNKDGQPDWKYMETYIKSIPYSLYL